MELIEVTPDNDDILRQWELTAEDGTVIAVKHRWKPGVLKEKPIKKSTRQLLEEILAKMP